MVSDPRHGELGSLRSSLKVTASRGVSTQYPQISKVQECTLRNSLCESPYFHLVYLQLAPRKSSSAWRIWTPWLPTPRALAHLYSGACFCQPAFLLLCGWAWPTFYKTRSVPQVHPWYLFQVRISWYPEKVRK